MTDAIATEDDYRQRLLDGMSAALLEKGYADTTIADIVRHARVSKRTFYEHFPDKQACMLACYAHNHERIIAVIARKQPTPQDQPIEKRLAQGLREFLAAAESQLNLMRPLMVEILAVGREGLRARSAAHKRFAQVLLELVENERRRQDSRLRPLSLPMATALVGGLHEFLLDAWEDGPAQSVKDLLDPLTDFVTSFLELDVPRLPSGIGTR